MWSAEAKAKIFIPVLEIKKGDKITITKGVKQKYAAWTSKGIFDLPIEYVDESSIIQISPRPNHPAQTRRVG